MKKLPGRKVLGSPEYDYSRNGYYFVTLCTHNKNLYFGRIAAEKALDPSLKTMILNENGEYLRSIIKGLEGRYENLLVDQFCIMPNHVHMIIAILDDSSKLDVGAIHESPDVEPVRKQRSLLSKAVGYIKMNTAKNVHLTNPSSLTVWQRGYYDHVVRDEEDRRIITRYIQTNAQRWNIDVFYMSEE